jgi:hypothetical protein
MWQELWRMSRGSELVIGFICLMLSAVWFILAPITGPTAPIGIWGILLAATLAGVIGFACVLTWGRPVTTRIAAGGLCVAMIASIVAIALSDDPEIGAMKFAEIVAVISGSCALGRGHAR